MPPLSLQQAFDLAIRHRQAGQPEPAAGLLEQILRPVPEQPDALLLLAGIEEDRRHFDRALALFGRYLAQRPADSAARDRQAALQERLVRRIRELIGCIDALQAAPGTVEALERLAAEALLEPSFYGFLYEGLDLVCRAGVCVPPLFERLVPLLIEQGNLAAAERLVRLLAAAQPSPRTAALLAMFLKAYREEPPLAGASRIGPPLARVDREHRNKAFRRLLGEGDPADIGLCLTMIPLSDAARHEAGLDREPIRLYQRQDEALWNDLRSHWQAGIRREDLWLREGASLRYRPSTLQDVLATPPVPLARPVPAEGSPLKVVCRFAGDAPRTATLLARIEALAGPHTHPVPLVARTYAPSDREAEFTVRLSPGTTEVRLAFSVSGRRPAGLPCSVTLDQDALAGAFMSGDGFQSRDHILL